MSLIDGTDPITSWWLAIVVLVLVTAVVAALLVMIIRTVSDIDTVVAEIWASGQRVANNTIHIAALYKTRDGVEAILGGAGLIAAHCEAIKSHAESCPGCPACFLAPKGGSA